MSPPAKPSLISHFHYLPDAELCVMADQQELNTHLLCERQQQLPHPPTIALAKMPERLVRCDEPTPLGRGKEKCGKAERECSNIDHSTTRLVDRVLQDMAVPHEDQPRLRPAPLPLEANLESVGFLPKDGLQATCDHGGHLPVNG